MYRFYSVRSLQEQKLSVLGNILLQNKNIANSERTTGVRHIRAHVVACRPDARGDSAKTGMIPPNLPHLSTWVYRTSIKTTFHIVPI